MEISSSPPAPVPVQGVQYAVNPANKGTYDRLGEEHSSSGLKITSSASLSPGLVSITGLKADTPYLLVEVRAPFGYQLLAEPVPFSFDGSMTVSIGRPGDHPEAVSTEKNRIVIADAASLVLPFVGRNVQRDRLYGSRVARPTRDYCLRTSSPATRGGRAAVVVVRPLQQGASGSCCSLPAVRSYWGASSLEGAASRSSLPRAARLQSRT